MTWAPSTEIRQHITSVVAASMEPIDREVQAAYIKALMAHMSFNGYRLNGAAFRTIQQRAETAGCLVMVSWDGIDYNWERYVDSMERHLEADFIRWVPAAVS